jgi:hypothetical protein
LGLLQQNLPTTEMDLLITSSARPSKGRERTLRNTVGMSVWCRNGLKLHLVQGLSDYDPMHSTRKCQGTAIQGCDDHRTSVPAGFDRDQSREVCRKSAVIVRRGKKRAGKIIDPKLAFEPDYSAGTRH